jgi:biotin transport system substrate-specific component
MLSIYMGLSPTFNQTVAKKQLQNLLINFIQVMGGSLFLALCSQIKIPVPFSIVPLTFQTLAVLLLGGFFGSKKGSLMVLTYLVETLMGMPVLAGGAIQSLALVGPKGGYLIGFVVQAYLMGRLMEKREHFNRFTVFFSGILICFFQLTLGVIWLSLFVGWSSAWTMGFYPFIMGEVLKVVVATHLFRRYSFGVFKYAKN